MNNIFINYRRDDSAWNAVALYQELAKYFPKENIFKDVNTITPGSDFVESIETALKDCGVLLVLISKNWITIKDQQGKIRINNPDDYVRLEIAAALKRNILVIPVLFDDATLPASGELPEDLQKLSRRQAISIEKSRLESDTIRLVGFLKTAVPGLNEHKTKKPVLLKYILGFALTAFLFAAVIFIYSRSVHQTGAAKVSGGNIDTGKNNIKAGTVSNEVVNSDKGCEPENVAFTNLNTAFKADLSSLPAKSDTNGKTGPSPYWSFYEMEAFSNVWIGSQFINLPNPLNNDFIFELWFQVKSGYPSISFTVSDAGENYANYNFILDVWEASAPDFSFTEGWTKNNFYASTTRQFSDRTKIPACFLKNIKWSEINHLSIKRENATVKYYLNNYLLQAVQASVFPIKKISLAIASKSIVDVTNIEAKIQ